MLALAGMERHAWATELVQVVRRYRSDTQFPLFDLFARPNDSYRRDDSVRLGGCRIGDDDCSLHVADLRDIHGRAVIEVLMTDQDDIRDRLAIRNPERIMIDPHAIDLDPKRRLRVPCHIESHPAPLCATLW
ncbi:hypothetical protein HRbin27_00768 [bacterium HR27]|nr:hypothetical protein HRbin27_00768 [bacterium HR27]